MATPLSSHLPIRSVIFDPLQASLQRRRSNSNKRGALSQKSFFVHPEVEDVRVSDPTNSFGSMVGSFRRSGEYSLPELPVAELRAARERRVEREGCAVEDGERVFGEGGEVEEGKLERSKSQPEGKEKTEMEEIMSMTRDDPMFQFQVRGRSLYEHVKF
mmetsp:Transcript_8859/g.22101  ORF Transcript_8859/g.22101 Transcript_8859/m.22101 type:complete len:159 (-) Transcript_8859:33-509(-)|eukprot:CAMPEP_0184710128 /NCGR_PEP_ID=MMETSP0314-20130426/1064_1 /TAXON_ID=38298 /ORGANISM="Rhodella maculata, Strain CCMP 736" /LENGTH=158 /DNA_ID=CAMNT_0027171923 /DNA_START=206 /DNA_END=682 /DNA_ORIENTATION=+